MRLFENIKIPENSTFSTSVQNQNNEKDFSSFNLANLTLQLKDVFAINQKTVEYTMNFFSILSEPIKQPLQNISRLPTHDIETIFDTLNHNVFTYNPQVVIVENQAVLLKNLLYPVQSLISIALQNNPKDIRPIFQTIINGGQFLSIYTAAASEAIDWYKPVQLYLPDYESHLKHQNCTAMLAKLFNFLGFSHHNVGLTDAHTLALKAREYVNNITDDNTDIKMINCFIMGYILYVKYERLEAQNQPLNKQYQMLLQAEQEFRDSYTLLQIQSLDKLENTNPMIASLLHALGTINYFKAKVTKKMPVPNNFEIAIQQSISYFWQSLQLRMALFGENSIHVARSHHKLGTAYELMSQPRQAIFNYTKALAIYNNSSLAPSHYIQELKTHISRIMGNHAQLLRTSGFFSQSTVNTSYHPNNRKNTDIGLPKSKL